MFDSGTSLLDNIVVGLFITIVGTIISAVLLPYISPPVFQAGGGQNVTGHPKPSRLALVLGVTISGLLAYLVIRLGDIQQSARTPAPTAQATVQSVAIVPTLSVVPQPLITTTSTPQINAQTEPTRTSPEPPPQTAEVASKPTEVVQITPPTQLPPAPQLPAPTPVPPTPVPPTPVPPTPVPPTPVPPTPVPPTPVPPPPTWTLAPQDPYSYEPLSADYANPEPGSVEQVGGGWTRIRSYIGTDDNGSHYGPWTFLTRIRCDRPVSNELRWVRPVILSATGPLSCRIEIRRDNQWREDLAREDPTASMKEDQYDVARQGAELGLGWFIRGSGGASVTVAGHEPVQLSTNAKQMEFPRVWDGSWVLTINIPAGGELTLNQGERRNTNDSWPLPDR